MACLTRASRRNFLGGVGRVALSVGAVGALAATADAMAQSAMKHGSSVQEIATVSQGLCRHGRLKGETAQGSVSVLSWNVQRYDAPWFQAAPWRLRRAGVLRRLRQIEADIVCLQEVLHPVRDDIEVALPGHRWVGVGRRDGRTEGEYAPILFRTAKYRMQDEGCFWLSEQPSRPSVGWDAQLPRIATWVRLEDAAGQSFLVLNTHFDHRGRRAREQSAWLLARETVRLSRGDPSIVTGDLNARARDDPLRTLQLFLVNGALDQRGHAEGPSATHLAGRIDHVLYSRHFARLAGRTLPARGLSDHATLHYVLARQEPGLIV